MSTTTKVEPWALLYAAALGWAFCYRIEDEKTLGEFFADDLLACAGNQLEDAVAAVGADRGKITRERILRAALIVFEAELAQRKRKHRPEFVARVREVSERLRRELQP